MIRDADNLSLLCWTFQFVSSSFFLSKLFRNNCLYAKYFLLFSWPFSKKFSKEYCCSFLLAFVASFWSSGTSVSFSPWRKFFSFTIGNSHRVVRARKRFNGKFVLATPQENAAQIADEALLFRPNRDCNFRSRKGVAKWGGGGLFGVKWRHPDQFICKG